MIMRAKTDTLARGNGFQGGACKFGVGTTTQGESMHAEHRRVYSLPKTRRAAKRVVRTNQSW